MTESNKICSQCKVEKSIDNFGFNSKVYNKRRSNCKDCQNEKVRKSRLKNHKIKYVKSSKHDFIWDFLLSVKCQICGNSDPQVLEFDHIDWTEKEQGISSLFHSTYEVLISELEKCRVLCSNCHIKHSHFQKNTWKSRMMTHYKEDDNCCANVNTFNNSQSSDGSEIIQSSTID